jgi:fatty acid-binding protein DegV
MTSNASGAYQAAMVAQSMMQESEPGIQIEVVDTRNVSLCQGWMAILKKLMRPYFRRRMRPSQIPHAPLT